MKLSRSIIAISLAVCVWFSVVGSASAANEYFFFSLQNTDTSYNVCTLHSNTKAYKNDSSTVHTYYVTTPGYGMAFCMKHYNGSTYITDTVTSPGQWLNNSGTIHPPYLSDHAVVGRSYCVAARNDNDYNGTYTSAGVFNSDYTNP